MNDVYIRPALAGNAEQAGKDDNKRICVIALRPSLGNRLLAPGRLTHPGSTCYHRYLGLHNFLRNKAPA